MNSLLAKLNPAAEKTANKRGQGTPAEESAATRSLRRHTTSSARSRKSVSEIFGSVRRRSIPQTVAADKAEITCKEQWHYPVYDPANPDHNPRCSKNNGECEPDDRQSRFTWSPSKISTIRDKLRKRSQSRSKSPSPAKRSFGLDTLAGTFKAAASLFYSEPTLKDADQDKFNRRADDCKDNQDVSTPRSSKSIHSKKSVRFRSGASFIDLENGGSSPIVIPSKSPLALPEIDTTGTFRLDEVAAEPDPFIGTARPPGTPMEQVLVPQSLSARTGMKICLEDITANKNKLATPQPTPTPGADLVIDNPFEDTAVMSKTAEKALVGYANSFRDDRKCSSSSTLSVLGNLSAATGKDGRHIEDSGENSYFTKSEDIGDVFGKQNGAGSNPNPFEIEDSTTLKKPLPMVFGASASPHPQNSETFSNRDRQDPGTLQASQVKQTGEEVLRKVLDRYDADSETYAASEESQPCGIASRGLENLGELDQARNINKESCDGLTDSGGSSHHDSYLDADADAAQTRARLGLHHADDNVGSSFSLPSTCSGTTSEIRAPYSVSCLKFGITKDSGKENACGGSSCVSSPNDPVKAQLPPGPDMPPLSPSEQQVLFPDDCVSPLKLSANISSQSPPRHLVAFKYQNSADDIPDDGAVDNTHYSWHSRAAVESALRKDETLSEMSEQPPTVGGTRFRLTTPSPAKIPLPLTAMASRTNRTQIEDSVTRLDLSSPMLSTPSPASIPLPETVLPIRTRKIIQSYGGTRPSNWSALHDPQFVLLAHKLSTRFPDDFRRLLLNEGISARLWKLLDLDSAQGPPTDGDAVNAKDLNPFDVDSFTENIRTEAVKVDKASAGVSMTIRQRLLLKKLEDGLRPAFFDELGWAEQPTDQPPYQAQDRKISLMASAASPDDKHLLESLSVKTSMEAGDATLAESLSSEDLAEFSVGNHSSWASPEDDRLPLVDHNFLRRFRQTSSEISINRTLL